MLVVLKYWIPPGEGDESTHGAHYAHLQTDPVDISEPEAAQILGSQLDAGRDTREATTEPYWTVERVADDGS